MVTWANDHYYDFVMNWVTHLKKLNVSTPAPTGTQSSSQRRSLSRTGQVTNYMVGAMDDKLLHKLLGMGIPTFAMRSGLTEKDFGC